MLGRHASRRLALISSRHQNFFRNKSGECGSKDIKDEIRNVVKDGVKFAASTFVSSFAESLAFYTILFIGGGAVLYYSASMMKSKFDSALDGARDKVKESREKAGKRIEDAFENEKIQTAMNKGGEILKGVERKVKDVDVPEIVENLKDRAKVHKVIEKGAILGNKIKENSPDMTDSVGKIKAWRLKMFGETAVEKEQHSELQQEEDPVVENETNHKDIKQTKT
jgi:hypothetical protein